MGSVLHGNSGENMMTLEGIRKLEEELEYLKTVKRQEVAERIKQAIAFGDLSENAEYDEAKNEQAFMEGRILILEQKLRSAKVIDEDDISDEVVSMGCTCKVLDLEFNETLEYAVVGSAEADPMHQRISNESPVGSALMGRAIGDIVDVSTPDGVIQVKILEIHK